MKVGDVAMILRDDAPFGTRVSYLGMIGIVIYISSNGCVGVHSGEGDRWFWFWDSKDLELLEETP